MNGALSMKTQLEATTCEFRRSNITNWNFSQEDLQYPVKNSLLTTFVIVLVKKNALLLLSSTLVLVS